MLKEIDRGTMEKRPLTSFLKTNLPEIPPKPPRGRWRFCLLFLFTALIIIFLIRSFSAPAASNNPYEYDPVTLEPKSPDSIIKKITNFVFKRQPELAGEQNDRINILILGMGGPGHNGPYLTDTIIIASIKPSTGQIAMVSVPRDLGVEIPDYGAQKINQANAYGEAKQTELGAVFARGIIEDTFDLKLPYYIRVDFQAFREIIDAVGGIKIDVARTFTDREFPAPGDNYQSLTFTTGVQTMDGERALQYTRSRHGDNGEGSDFARAKRQQKVILALKEKILSFQTLANPVRISKIIKSLDKHINTNLELTEVISFLKIGRTVNLSNIITLVFDVEENKFLESAYTEAGVYILRPRLGNFKDMRTAIKNIFDFTGENDTTPSQDTPASPSVNLRQTDAPTPAPPIDNIKSGEKVEIQNGTWRAGLAARIKTDLAEAGITVSLISNTNMRPINQSGIYLLDEMADSTHLEKIRSILSIPLWTELPAGETAAAGTDVLIILGEDYIE